MCDDFRKDTSATVGADLVSHELGAHHGGHLAPLLERLVRKLSPRDEQCADEAPPERLSAIQTEVWRIARHGVEVRCSDRE